MTDFYHNHESTRVDSLIPQQLREGSAELVKFLSEYYIGENDIAISAQDSTYIDVASSLIQNLAKNRDLDRVTQTQFIEELAFEVAKNIQNVAGYYTYLVLSSSYLLGQQEQALVISQR